MSILASESVISRVSSNQICSRIVPGKMCIEMDVVGLVV